jgi:hypothetical protein
MKTIRILLCIPALVLSLAAQSFHVTAVRFTPRCLRCSDSFSILTITGTIGENATRLKKIARYGDTRSINLASGQDYPVVNATDDTVEVSGTDRRGKQRTEKLHVIKVEEIN